MSLGLQCRVFIVVMLVSVLISEPNGSAQACDLDQAQSGCRIDNGGCTCAFGCKSEYRYATRKECLDALKGRSDDVCGRQPCLNGGTCIQVSQSPGYRCRCEGTGFWGNRCQRQCPTTTDRHYPTAEYPYECIVI